MLDYPLRFTTFGTAETSKPATESEIRGVPKETVDADLDAVIELLSDPAKWIKGKFFDEGCYCTAGAMSAAISIPVIGCSREEFAKTTRRRELFADLKKKRPDEMPLLDARLQAMSRRICAVVNPTMKNTDRAFAEIGKFSDAPSTTHEMLMAKLREARAK